MDAREFGHSLQIGFDFCQSHRPGVAGEVIGTGENDDNFRYEIDYVRAKANEHLWSRLSSYASVDIRSARKGLLELPHVSDRVTQEHHAVLPGVRRRQLGVGLVVPSEVAEVGHPEWNEALAVVFQFADGSHTIRFRLGKDGGR